MHRKFNPRDTLKIISNHFHQGRVPASGTFPASRVLRNKNSFNLEFLRKCKATLSIVKKNLKIQEPDLYMKMYVR